MPDRADADDVVDDLDDLDDGATPASRSPRPGRPPRWAGSRWALPAAVAAVIVVVGAAGVHQARVAAAADLARAQQLASLQLNVPSVFSTDRTPRHDARGRLLQQVQVQAYNAGAAAVRVTPLATSLTTAELLPAAEPLTLAPGSGSLLTLVLAVDCAAVPPPGQGGSVTPTTDLDATAGAASWLQLAVESDGRRSEQRYLLPGQVWGSDLSEQLGYACSPDRSGDSTSASAEVDGEGRLQVSVDNTSQDQVRVVLDAPAALHVSSDTPLPLEVPARTTQRLLLSLDPACPELPQVPGSSPLQADLSLDLGGGTTQPLTDSTTTAAWVARQVALRCG